MNNPKLKTIVYLIFALSVCILCFVIQLVKNSSAGLSLDSLDKLSGQQKTEMLERVGQLNQAAAIGDLTAVCRLIEQGALLDAPHNGLTALHVAAINKHPKVCDALLKAGAHARGCSKREKNPIDVSDQNGLMPADYAARNSEVLQVFLDAGVPIESTGWYGQTMLFEAVQADAVESVKLLIQRGANVNASTPSTGSGPMQMPSITPIQLAKNAEIKELLINAGANTNDAKNVASQQTEQEKIRKENLESIKAFVERTVPSRNKKNASE